MPEYLSVISRTVGNLDPDILVEVCKKDRPVVCWRISPTDTIHLGYYLPLVKLIELRRLGFRAKILISDTHLKLTRSYLTDNQIKNRTEYYVLVITEMIRGLGENPEDYTIIIGNSFQYSPEYMKEMFELCGMCTTKDVKRLLETQKDSLSVQLYPVVFALDEQYVGADLYIGGKDKKRLFEFANEYLPMLGYEPKAHLVTKTAKSLCGNGESKRVGVMDSSGEKSTFIDILDTRQQIREKVGDLVSIDGETDGNRAIEFVDTVLREILRVEKKFFSIFRTELCGGPLVFKSMAQLRQMFEDGELKTDELKRGILNCVDHLVEDVRKTFESREKQQILKHAYPILKAM